MAPGLNTVLLYKPYGVLSQFTHEAGHPSLADLGPFPPALYPVGRLDADSEGMLLLTEDNRLKHRLTDPRFGHPRTYLVQVERVPDREALERLRRGIVLDGTMTRPARARLLEEEPALPVRVVPIRFRKSVPTAWLEITVSEGRNRQVRRMTAAAGHPTLRLVRVRIGALGLGRLGPGEHRVLTERDVALALEGGQAPTGGSRPRRSR